MSSRAAEKTQKLREAKIRVVRYLLDFGAKIEPASPEKEKQMLQKIKRLEFIAEHGRDPSEEELKALMEPYPGEICSVLVQICSDS